MCVLCFFKCCFPQLSRKMLCILEVAEIIPNLSPLKATNSTPPPPLLDPGSFWAVQLRKQLKRKQIMMVNWGVMVLFMCMAIVIQIQQANNDSSVAPSLQFCCVCNFKEEKQLTITCIKLSDDAEIMMYIIYIISQTIGRECQVFMWPRCTFLII